MDQLYAFLSSHELTRDIGETVEYSNLGVGLLGHSSPAGTAQITRPCGEAVLAPLGMNDTAIALTPPLRERLASGHDQTLEPVPQWTSPLSPGRRAAFNSQRHVDVHRSKSGSEGFSVAKGNGCDPCCPASIPGAEHGNRARMDHPYRARPHDPLAQRRHGRLSLVPRLRPVIAERCRGAVKRCI